MRHERTYAVGRVRDGPEDLKEKKGKLRKEKGRKEEIRKEGTVRPFERVRGRSLCAMLTETKRVLE